MPSWVKPPAMIKGSAVVVLIIIPLVGTPLPPGVGHVVIQSVAIQNPASDRTLPVALAVPVTSRLYVELVLPTLNLAPVPNNDPTTPVRLKGPTVEVPLVELTLIILVPAALVTLKVAVPLAEGVKVAVPPNKALEDAVKAPFNVNAPDFDWALDPILIGADKFSPGGVAVAACQAPLAIEIQITTRARAQPLIAMNLYECIFCSMIFLLIIY
jgi:hypothetical protein